MGAVLAAATEGSFRSFPALSAMLLVTLAGAVVTMVLPRRRPEWSRAAGLFASVITLGIAVAMLLNFAKDASFQFVEHHQWINLLGSNLDFGVDGISLFMVVLTAVLIPIGLLASSNVHDNRAFTVWMLLLEFSVIGVFAATDLLVFFVFFELVLVPMYFLIAGWGHGRNVYAATKFFLYTMAGSAFLFASLLTLAVLHQKATGDWTFSIDVLTKWASNPHSMSETTARLLFAGMAISFAVKVPLFPLHTWLPDAHTEAPTAGSVVLAGVLLKMGTYGFLRLAIPMFPNAAQWFAPAMLTLAVIGIIYGAIVAAMQPDLKRLIAYSSVAHLGFVVLGTFALTREGMQGGLFTMVSHGLTTGALFLLVGMLYDRRHTRLIADFGGLWKSVPILSGLFAVAMFASIGLPGFSGFVGEFTSLFGTFLTHRWWAVVATFGVILAAVYLLWAFQRAFTGEPSGENVGLPDINFREVMTVVPLLALSLFLGFYPKPLFSRTEPAVNKLMQQVEQATGDHQPTPKPVAATQEAGK